MILASASDSGLSVKLFIKPEGQCFIFLLFWFRCPEPQNGHEWVLGTMISGFERTKFEENHVKHDGDTPGPQFGHEAAEHYTNKH